MMITYLITGVAIALAVSFPFNFIAICRAKKEMRSSRSRYHLTEIATEIQKHMKNGVIKDGEECHEILYKMVFCSQFSTKYISLKAIKRSMFSGHSSLESRIRAMNEELRKKPKDLRELYGRFFLCYAQSMREQSTFLFTFFVAYCIAKALKQSHKNWQAVYATAKVNAAKSAGISSFDCLENCIAA